MSNSQVLVGQIRVFCLDRIKINNIVHEHLWSNLIKLDSSLDSTCMNLTTCKGYVSKNLWAVDRNQGFWKHVRWCNISVED